MKYVLAEAAVVEEVAKGQHGTRIRRDLTVAETHRLSRRHIDTINGQMIARERALRQLASRQSEQAVVGIEGITLKINTRRISGVSIANGTEWTRARDLIRKTIRLHL